MATCWWNYQDVSNYHCLLYLHVCLLIGNALSFPLAPNLSAACLRVPLSSRWEEDMKICHMVVFTFLPWCWGPMTFSRTTVWIWKCLLHMCTDFMLTWVHLVCRFTPIFQNIVTVQSIYASVIRQPTKLKLKRSHSLKIHTLETKMKLFTLYIEHGNLT